MTPLVYIVILNWNGREDTLVCLESVARLGYSNCRVIVADNGSTDGALGEIARLYPRVRLIENGANLGFAAGNNHAIRTTTAPWIALLNNDTIPDPGWLGALVAAAEADARIGSVASRMCFCLLYTS